MASDVTSVERVFGICLDHFEWTWPSPDSTRPQFPSAATDTISQPDPKDPTSVSSALRTVSTVESSKFLASLPSPTTSSLQGLRIGIPIESFPSSLTPSSLAPFRALLKTLRDRGATLHSVSTPLAPHALGAYYVIASAEASSNLARFDGVKWGSRGPGKTFKEVAEGTRSLFGEEVKKRILVGTYSLSAECVFLSRVSVANELPTLTYLNLDFFFAGRSTPSTCRR